MTRKRIVTILGAVIGVMAAALVLAGVLHDGGTAEAQAPPPTYTKVSMPDFGQHSTGWCWVAAAANSFWWYGENVARYEGLLGGAGKPWKNTDTNSQDAGSACWYDANDPLQGPGYRQLLSKIAQTTFYDKVQDGVRDPDGADNIAGTADDENNYCYSEGVEKWDYLIGLRDYVAAYVGSGLKVHDIIDPLRCPEGSGLIVNRAGPLAPLRSPCGPDGVGGVPGVEQVVQPGGPTFLDYRTELSRSQDVLLWMEPPTPSSPPETAHVVTGVGYDTAPNPDTITISDPWTHDDLTAPAQHDDAWLAAAPENPGANCNDVLDNDGDGRVNDGCIAVAPGVETGAQCADTDSDDADGVVNDGCPPMGAPDHNNSPSHEAPPLPARPYDTCTVVIPGPPAGIFTINCGGTTWTVYDMIFVSPVSVGGIAQLPDVASDSGSSTGTYAALAGGLAAAVLALTAGAWYARRRWVR